MVCFVGKSLLFLGLDCYSKILKDLSDCKIKLNSLRVHWKNEISADCPGSLVKLAWRCFLYLHLPVSESFNKISENKVKLFSQPGVWMLFRKLIKLLQVFKILFSISCDSFILCRILSFINS